MSLSLSFRLTEHTPDEPSMVVVDGVMLLESNLQCRAQYSRINSGALEGHPQGSGPGDGQSSGPHHLGQLCKVDDSTDYFSTLFWVTRSQICWQPCASVMTVSYWENDNRLASVDVKV